MNRTLALVLLASLPPGAALAQSFQDGDVYLVSAALPKAPNSSQPGVMKIDPVTWATAVVSTNTIATSGRASYDSFRDRLVFRALSFTGPMVLMAADGTTSTLAYAGAQDAINPAAAGDGRVYFAHNGTKQIAYVDGEGTTHDVMNIGGAGIATTTSKLRFTHFDVASNSLILAFYNLSPLPANRVERITLSASGDQVVSWAGVDFAVGSSGETTVGMSTGPDGTVFIKLDDNTNSSAARMQLLDLATMTVSTFASSFYTGVAGEIAGAYCPGAGGALTIDSANDKLRFFAAGAAGAGAVLATDVSSASGSGELAQIVPIVRVCTADIDHNGFVTGDDFDLFSAWFEAGDPSADFDHNTFVNGDDFDAFTEHFIAGC